MQVYSLINEEEHASLILWYDESGKCQIVDFMLALKKKKTMKIATSHHRDV